MGRENAVTADRAPPLDQFRLPSCGQATQVVAFSRRSCRGRLVSQYWPITRLPVKPSDSREASQTTASCMTSGCRLLDLDPVHHIGVHRAARQQGIDGDAVSRRS